MKNLLLLVMFVISSTAFSQDVHREIKMLSLNIWQEGTVVDGGYNAIVDEVASLQPDFVAFSEVRNYNNSDFGKRMVESLKKRGITYYSFKSYDSGLLSRHPITDSTTIFHSKTDNGSIYKLVTYIDDQKFAVYTAHLDYLNCAYYLPRGYDGNTWEYSSKPVTIKQIKDMNLASQRHISISKFIKNANIEYENGSIVILGGDFNEPSMLDWTKETKNLYDHNDIVYKWDVSAKLLKNGYLDSYREFHPSVVEYPGFTYPSANKNMSINKLTWAPKSDERERIDFIYYKAKGDFILKNVTVLGPKASIKNSKEYIENINEKHIAPIDIWPSDHKGVVAVFELSKYISKR